MFGDPPQKPIRLACVGLGYIFRNAHADALACLQAHGWPVEVAMVCDREPAALDGASERFPSAKPTSNLEEVLDRRDEADALLICLYPPLSLDFLRRSIARGFKRILIEKPVSHSAADIRHAANEAGSAGAHVHVAYNRLHHPALGGFVRAAKELGGIESVSAKLLRADRKEPGFYADVTPHPLSVLHDLFGELTVQNVSFGDPKNGIPEFLEVTLKSAGGVPATLEMQPSSGEIAEHYEAQSAGQHLSLPFLSPSSATGWNSSVAGVSSFHGVPDPTGLSEELLTNWRTGFLPQIAGFLRDEPPRCSLDQAAKPIFYSLEGHKK